MSAHLSILAKLCMTMAVAGVLAGRLAADVSQLPGEGLPGLIDDQDAVKTLPGLIRKPAPARPPHTTSPAKPKKGSDKQLLPLADDAVLASDEDCECAEFCGQTLCGPPERFWMRADYLMWWTRGVRLPSLVATGTDELPEDITAILFGNAFIHDDGRSGGRVRMGYWLNECHRCGIEGEYFTFGADKVRYSATSSGDPVLLRPFWDVEQGAAAVEVIAAPEIAVGTISGSANEFFQSAGLWYRHNLLCRQGCDCGECCEDDCGIACHNLRSLRVDAIAGYRFYRLHGNVAMNESVVSTDPGGDVPIGTMFNLSDTFRAVNDFHGLELGLVANARRNRWSLEILAKLALGGNRRSVSVSGATDITEPGEETVHYTGGLLALQSNIGDYHSDGFALIPQIGVEVGYELTCRTRVFMGYNFLYWANVSRAASQIDLNIDPRNIPPVEQGATDYPAFPFAKTDFWAQGVNAGLEIRF